MFLPIGDDVEKREPPIATAVLIAANLLVFLYMFRLTVDAGGDLRPHFEFCREWGLVARELAQGRFVELFTSMFLHGDFFHFAGNMFVLWAFAQTLEYVLGKGRFALLYLLTGLAAGVAQCAADFRSEIPMVGASGAIAGVMGAYCVAFGPTTRVRTLMWLGQIAVVPIPACIFAVVWLLSQWLGVIDSRPEEGGVAWMAHIGGFLAGMALMPLLNDGSRQLVRDWRSGTLTVTETQPAEAPPSRPTAPAAPPQPASPACVYCGTDLAQATALAETLLRCGNPKCHRLNYATAPPPRPAEVAAPAMAEAVP